MSSASSIRKPSKPKSGFGDSVLPANFGQLLTQLGEIPPERVRLSPPPGQAKKRDLVQLLHSDSVLCELVDGTLVEKAVGQIESVLGGWLIHCLWAYLETRDLGRVYGADAPCELRPRLIRLPDVSFVSYGRIPQGEARKRPVATWVPELAVEILSKGNSKKEINRKVSEYFAAGVLLVWVVDPRKKSVRVYTAKDVAVTLEITDQLEGGDVLPGFSISIQDWFSKIE